MGVIYKLKQEVVQFIVSQRQENPLLSCRQLAESASQKFGLQLSKSSVHDVLKESGIVTPRGRKPRASFAIPQEKNKQIQTSLSKINLLPSPVEPRIAIAAPQPPPLAPKVAPVILPQDAVIQEIRQIPAPQEEMDVSAEYEEAGNVFLKAALLDLGVFSEPQEKDWGYLLTYAKGLKVFLENGKDFFIELPLPIERCIRETADGLINNVKPMIVHKVSDQELFKASMEAASGFKIIKISIVDKNDHEMLEFSSIVEQSRKYLVYNRVFVDCNEKDMLKRFKTLFFTQAIESHEFINNILKLRGFDSSNEKEKIVTLLVKPNYEDKDTLQTAVQRINEMYLQDDQDRQLKVRLQETLS